MKKILIIEDDQIVANIYRNKFCIEGFQVEVALDGHVGFEMVRSFRPDAVVLDLMLPKLTGVDLMRRIRSEPGFDQLPLIVFSNTYLTAMVEEAWKAGATKCLSKSSCTPQQVIDAVRSTLANNGGGLAGVPTRAATPARAHDSVAPTPPRAPEPPKDRLLTSDADSEFQAELRKSFLESLPGTMAALRMLLQGLIKADNE